MSHSDRMKAFECEFCKKIFFSEPDKDGNAKCGVCGSMCQTIIVPSLRSKLGFALRKTGAPLILMIGFIISGCAASPYAWQDLGDGEGIRGWAGIPLKYSVPVGLAAGAQGFSQGMQNAPRTPIPRFGTFQTNDGRFGTYYETGGY